MNVKFGLSPLLVLQILINNCTHNTVNQLQVLFEKRILKAEL